MMESIVEGLRSKGLEVGTVKHHAHPGLEFDRPGKDSYRLRAAGSTVSAVSAPDGIAMVREVEDEWPPSRVAQKLMPNVDIVLTEGYSSSDLSRIVIATEFGDEELFGSGPIIAVLKRNGFEVEGDFPVLKAGETEKLLDLLEDAA